MDSTSRRGGRGGTSTKPRATRGRTAPIGQCCCCCYTAIYIYIYIYQSEGQEKNCSTAAREGRGERAGRRRASKGSRSVDEPGGREEGEGE